MRNLVRADRLRSWERGEELGARRRAPQGTRPLNPPGSWEMRHIKRGFEDLSEGPNPPGPRKTARLPRALPASQVGGTPCPEGEVLVGQAWLTRAKPHGEQGGGPRSPRILEAPRALLMRGQDVQRALLMGGRMCRGLQWQGS